MNVWAWIVLYVVLFGLLQVLIYRYLRSGEDAPLMQSTPPIGERPAPDDMRKERVLEEVGEHDSSVHHDPSVRQCPHCGTENGVEYTYCRECVEPLGVW